MNSYKKGAVCTRSALSEKVDGLRFQRIRCSTTSTAPLPYLVAIKGHVVHTDTPRMQDMRGVDAESQEIKIADESTDNNAYTMEKMLMR